MEQSKTSPSTPPPDHKPRRSGRPLGVALVLLLLLAAGAAGYWYFFARGIVSSDDARFAGKMVDLAPEIGGRLNQVRVREGDRVKKGQILFSQDKRLLSAALAQARANEQSARASLALAKAAFDKAIHGSRREELMVARAEVARLESSLRLAATELSRAKNLFRGSNLPRSQLDQAQTKWEMANQAHQEAKGKLKLLIAGSRSEDIAIAKANLDLAEARLQGAIATTQQAGTRLELTEIRAPFDGFIVRRWLDPGAVAAAAQPVLTLLDPESLYVAANIDEKDLGRVRIGDRVDISVDAYPDLHLTGRVKDILRATNSQFGLIPAEGSGGTFIKVAQRVPLRIEIDHLPEVRLGRGLSVEVHIRVGGHGFSGKIASVHD